ncbi:MAG: hypothetical protein ACFFED_08315 [Candidatus Thorarchaeota archaeon]
MSDSLPSQFRDRDIIRDTDGRIFVVLGHIQPHDRVLAFLKYVPDPNGKWLSEGQRYRRTFWGDVGSVVNGLLKVPTEYLADDLHFGTELLEVPLSHIQRHFIPESRLDEIRKDGPADRLESLAAGLADALHDTLGVSYSDMGVAGSILWKGHSPEFSDINMNIYGFQNSWALKESYESVSAAEKVRLRTSDEWVRGANRILERVPALTQDDIDKLFERRFAFYYDNQCIGVTPVLRPAECPIPYGSESYHQVSVTPIKVRFEVENVSYSLFSPSIVEGTTPSLQQFEGVKASRLLIYEGIYSGLFNVGDHLEVTGMLQRVHPMSDNREDFYQLMIGTKDGAGIEYIRILT